MEMIIMDDDSGLTNDHDDNDDEYSVKHIRGQLHQRRLLQ